MNRNKHIPHLAFPKTVSMQFVNGLVKLVNLCLVHPPSFMTPTAFPKYGTWASAPRASKEHNVIVIEHGMGGSLCLNL